jgi:hypothetical protein
MASQDNYQPAPWFHDGSRILNSSFRALGTIAFPADARRIVACVNACEGLPTALVEGGIIRRLLERHVEELEAEAPGLKRFLERRP